MINLRDNQYLKFKNNVIQFDDILFLHQDNAGQEQFEYLVGNKVLDKESINTFQANMNENNRMSQQYHFLYKHIIFPVKATVYTEKFSKIGIQIKQIATDAHINCPSVYYPILDQKCYPTDDTHTNDRGVIKILDKVLEDFGLEPLPTVIYKEHHIEGDLSVMLHSKKPLIQETFDSFEGKILNTSYTKHFTLFNALEGNSGYFNFLINPLAIHKKRIILFGDSFFSIKLHIFSQVFEEVIFMRNAYIYEDIIKILEPDIVLTGNAERYLTSVPDALKPRPYFLNYITPKFHPDILDPETIRAFNVLFTPRKGTIYKKFKENYKISILNKLNKNIYDLTEHDLLSNLDINVCRDLACELESTDIYKAFHLMKIAYKSRPTGPFIKQKYHEYKTMLQEKR